MVNEWIHTKRAKIIIWSTVIILLLMGVYFYTHRNQGGVKRGDIPSGSHRTDHGTERYDEADHPFW